MTLSLEASTPKAVLEYFPESTGVLTGEDWSTSKEVLTHIREKPERRSSH